MAARTQKARARPHRAVKASGGLIVSQENMTTVDKKGHPYQEVDLNIASDSRVKDGHAGKVKMERCKQSYKSENCSKQAYGMCSREAV